MASYLVQSGTELYFVSQSGTSTLITLPTGITLTGSTSPCRAVLFGSAQNPVILVVNGGSNDFWIDTAGTARKLSISSPIAAPVPAAGSGTGLTGVYYVAATYKIKDSNGTTIFETGMSPLSTATSSLVNKSILVGNIPVSGDALINARGIYRTLSGGTTLYPWFDIDNNTGLTADRAVADSLLSILPTTATRNGTLSSLKLITSWKDRLWGVTKNNPDYVNWTDERLFYGWSADNQFLAPPQKTNTTGVTAFIPRRDQLGIARQNRLYQITGFSNDTFQRSAVSETIGCLSQESVVIVRNVAYFLGTNGVVEWGASGIGYISEAQVDPWFRSDDTFNRAQFINARGRYNPITDSYELLLASVGQSTLNRWISYDLGSRTWYGPHKTSAFTPSCTASNSDYWGIIFDSNTLPLTAFGGTDGYLYKRSETVDSDHTSAIDFQVDLPFLNGGDPDIDSVWLDPTIHTTPQTSGTLTIIPTVGNIDASASPTLYHDLSKERERLARLGQGRYCQLSLRHSVAGEGVTLRGIEIPVLQVGRR